MLLWHSTDSRAEGQHPQHGCVTTYDLWMENRTLFSCSKTCSQFLVYFLIDLKGFLFYSGFLHSIFPLIPLLRWPALWCVSVHSCTVCSIRNWSVMSDINKRNLWLWIIRKTFFFFLHFTLLSCSFFLLLHTRLLNSRHYLSHQAKPVLVSCPL